MVEESESTHLTSLTLLEQLGEQSPGSWERFVRLYAPLVYGWARNAGVEPDHASDIRQEVFKVVWQKLPTFDSDRSDSGGFRSWLWGITRLQMLDHFRRESAQTPGAGGSSANFRLQELTEGSDEPESVAGNSAHQIVVQSAMEILQSETASDTWQSFYRMAVKGDSAKTIGEELGMTSKAVRQAKFRVTQKLRELVGTDFPLLLQSDSEHS